MKILVLGGDGMLGHQLLQSFQYRHDVRVTLRQDFFTYATYGLFDSSNSYFDVDVRSYERLVEVIADCRPEVVVNAVGIVKQRSDAKESIPSLEINALLPHRLAVLCRGIGARLVHLSTDCVFSGEKGGYTEDDSADALDLYGKSKYLGEVREENCITLRTSIIGRELSRKKSLLEWFLAQRGTIKGFRKAIYTGFSTIEMARIIEKMLLNYPQASGVYHVSSQPINKYELLCLFREKFGVKVQIEPDDSFVSDRSLDSSRFRKEFDYIPPIWDKMVEEMSQCA